MAVYRDTIVVGGGQAGLSTSYHLTRAGRDHLVLERGRTAETWRTQRWDGFVLNTPNWAQRLPGFHYDGPNPDGFAPLEETISYLEDYARAIDAPVREHTEVTAVRRRGDGFAVETADETFSASTVVIAAGAYQHPTPSPIARALPTHLFQLHTSEYRRPEQLPDGAVLIVGSGQSGCQIADELLDAGRSVYLSVGRCPWFPRRYRDRELVHWLLDTGLADDTVDSLPSPAARLACNPPVSGNDGGHDCNPRWLAARGATLLGRVAGVDGSTIRIGPGLDASLEAGDAFVAGFRRRADEYVQARGLDVADPEPDEPHAPVPLLSELDLRAAGVSTILWANGFRPDHTWIEGLAVDEHGWPVQVRGVSSLPGLYFVGLHWLHKRKSALFVGVGEDAEYVVSHLTA